MKKRYWLRGGLIALVFGSIVSLGLSFFSFSTHDISDVYGSLTETVFNFFANILMISPLRREGFSVLQTIVIMAVYLFLLGSFIGYFYGKFKNRKTVI